MYKEFIAKTACSNGIAHCATDERLRFEFRSSILEHTQSESYCDNRYGSMYNRIKQAKKPYRVRYSQKRDSNIT